MSDGTGYRENLGAYLRARADADREEISRLRSATRRDPEVRRAVREVDDALGPPPTPKTDLLVVRLFLARRVAYAGLFVVGFFGLTSSYGLLETGRGTLEDARNVVAYALVVVALLSVLAGGLIGAGAAVRLAREPGWRTAAAVQGALACVPSAFFVLAGLYLALSS